MWVEKQHSILYMTLHLKSAANKVLQEIEMKNIDESESTQCWDAHLKCKMQTVETTIQCILIWEQNICFILNLCTWLIATDWSISVSFALTVIERQ